MIFFYTVSWKKWNHLPLIRSNAGQFSKFFHQQTYQQISSNTLIKHPTTPQMCRYTTLWNYCVQNGSSEKLFVICKSLTLIYTNLRPVRHCYKFGFTQMVTLNTTHLTSFSWAQHKQHIKWSHLCWHHWFSGSFGKARQITKCYIQLQPYLVEAG